MNDQLAAKLKYLQLSGLLEHWDEYLKLADEPRGSPGQWLTQIVEEEYRLKRARRRDFRLQKAGLPEPWVIASYPFERQPKLNQKKIMALYDSLEYLRQSQNILW
jgi:hypothetical protein